MGVAAALLDDFSCCRFLSRYTRRLAAARPAQFPGERPSLAVCSQGQTTGEGCSDKDLDHHFGSASRVAWYGAPRFFAGCNEHLLAILLSPHVANCRRTAGRFSVIVAFASVSATQLVFAEIFYFFQPPFKVDGFADAQRLVQDRPGRAEAHVFRVRFQQ